MSDPLQAILIGTSLSQMTDGVVQTAVKVARATGAVPWLIHVFTVPVLPTEMGAIGDSWVEEQVCELRQLALAQAARTGLDELPGFSGDRVRVVLGSPAREIPRFARAIGAGLVVVGAQDDPSRFRKAGSTADRVVRGAGCPVLVVRSSASFPPAKIEIPVDLSAVSGTGLRRGLELLGRLGVPLGGTEVLFVLDPAEAAGSRHFTGDQVLRFAGEELSRFVAANSGKGVSGTALRVRTGFAREEILAALEEREVDLAILGTHGRSGFERLVLGSIAAGVLHEAGCNVLLVPPVEPAVRQAAPARVRSEPLREAVAAAAGGGAMAGRGSR